MLYNFLNLRIVQVLLNLRVSLYGLIHWITFQLFFLFLSLLFSLRCFLVGHSAEVVTHETGEFLHDFAEFWIASVFRHALLGVLAEFLEDFHELWVLKSFQQLGILRQLLKELRSQPVLLRLVVVCVHRCLDFFEFKLIILGLRFDVRLVF